MSHLTLRSWSSHVTTLTNESSDWQWLRMFGMRWQHSPIHGLLMSHRDHADQHTTVLSPGAGKVGPEGPACLPKCEAKYSCLLVLSGSLTTGTTRSTATEAFSIGLCPTMTTRTNATTATSIGLLSTVTTWPSKPPPVGLVKHTHTRAAPLPPLHSQKHELSSVCNDNSKLNTRGSPVRLTHPSQRWAQSWRKRKLTVNSQTSTQLM